MAVGSSIPSFSSMAAASPCTFQNSWSCDIFCTTFSSTVRLGSKTGFCGRYETFRPFLVMICPSSGSSAPAMIASRVDFPVPLIPITPTRS